MQLRVAAAGAGVGAGLDLGRGEFADARRSAVIEAKGFKVLRFSNCEVMTNRSGVLETIVAAVAERAPTPPLPRKRGRERTEPAEKKQP